MDDEIDRLAGLSTFELRSLWRRYWNQPPPMRLSRDLLIRGLAWKLQDVALGGLGKLDQRKLAALAKGASEQRSAAGSEDGRARDHAGLSKRTSANAVNTAIILREGNRLVREWNGTTHTVMVLAEGFEWQGNHYRSLSQIAESITGAHWSGPRFFGLAKRKPDSKSAAPKLPVSAEPNQIADTITGRT